jgi:hypothetical protein
MSEKIRSLAISRRKVLFLVRLAAGLVVPVTVLASSNAEAQHGESRSPAPSSQATPGEQITPKKKKKKKPTSRPGMAPQTTQPKA